MVGATAGYVRMCPFCGNVRVQVPVVAAGVGSYYPELPVLAGAGFSVAVCVTKPTFPRWGFCFLRFFVSCCVCSFLLLQEAPYAGCMLLAVCLPVTAIKIVEKMTSKSHQHPAFFINKTSKHKRRSMLWLCYHRFLMKVP